MTVVSSTQDTPSRSSLGPEARTVGRGVVLEAVGLRRRGLCLVEDLSIVVAPGETLAIMGRSGVGKTTLLRTIAGLTTPASGQVLRQDGRVAMIFQDPRLLPWRTALENVELVCSEHESGQAYDWLARVGLEDAVYLYPSALSGGMRQRVAIARAMAHDAPIVLVDEPFSNLDAETRRKLYEDLLPFISNGERPVVWVTHDPIEATAIAQRTLVLDGPPDGSWTLVAHDGDSPLARIKSAIASPSQNHRNNQTEGTTTTC